MRRTGSRSLIACLLGIPAGVGAFTFVYAKGYSYLSADPRTCVNCRIMTPQHEAWRKSGHRHAAICGFAGVAGDTVLPLALRTNIFEHHALLQRAATATRDMLDVIVAARKAGAGEADLKVAAGLHRKAQWRLDFVAAKNSMGFHAPQELARILGETIDFARQGQLEAKRAARKT